MATTQGIVYLVGAGPGDPELITVKGANILNEADVIVYDRLANPELFSMTSGDSEHIYVGKRPDKPSVSQSQINHILITKAREGKTVARLKGGDPFVFGRGGEECEALRAERISYEIIPGISSALAAPAFAGVPVTHRKVARSVTIVTGHTVKGSDDFENWRHLALADTLVILMGMRNLAKIADKLIKYGRDSSTPVAVVEKATFEVQQVATGTLSDIAEKAKGLSSPGTIIIGEVAAKSESLAWFQQYKLDEVAGYEYQQPIPQLS
ncbi:MAG TPA: uroporphyrinogen-III C-methyltransferase [Fodinibius sp.]|nr:uroporphyrinogen-III C-methyltransferase [Fodinibius sp.]